MDYDLGDEWIMQEFGTVREGKLVIGEREYSLVILPPNMETCLPSTVDLLGEYLAHGGRVLALGEPPSLVRGRPDDAPARLPEEHAADWERIEDVEALVARARKLVPPCVTAPDGCPLPADLVCRREEMDGGRAALLLRQPVPEGHHGRGPDRGRQPDAARHHDGRLRAGAHGTAPATARC